MNSLFDSLQQYDDDHDIDGKIRHAFEAKALKAVAKFFDIEVADMVDDPEFGFQWFHEEVPKFPVRLDARKLKVNLRSLFKCMTNTELWEEYHQAREDSQAKRFALITPIEGAGMFAIHNCWDLPMVPGYTRLTRQAKTQDKGIVLEPLEAFLSSLRTQWTP